MFLLYSYTVILCLREINDNDDGDTALLFIAK